MYFFSFQSSMYYVLIMFFWKITLLNHKNMTLLNDVSQNIEYSPPGLNNIVITLN